MIIPVILSGGSGTRLWPLSREAYPKQFLSLMGDRSFFQSTAERLSGLNDCTPPLIVSNEEHRFLVAEQLRQIGSEASGIILEPVGRNTAPAVTCAALLSEQQHKNSILLVMPSDHVIQDTEAFRSAVAIGAKAAEIGQLVTFGIVARHPETGYGYIRRQAAPSDNDATIFPVAEFVEKPDIDTASSYVASGQYYWNSGIFMFQAKTFLEEMGRFSPDILDHCRDAISNISRDLDFTRLDKTAFTACPSDSIDYAVMEKTARAVVVPLDAGWNDIGAWSALWEISQPDKHGNVTSGDVLTEDVENCYIRGEHRLISGIGINNLIVVETADAVLIADKSRAQDVKKITAQLKQSGRNEHLHHVRVYRPWGSYETVNEGDRFKVKRIIVKPGESLSLQMHHHRAEHWVVVKGTAKVTRGNDEMLISEDQSIYIPIGTQHRLVNPGLVPLELIEVQTGSYLGEDDIVRFTDNYGRA